MNKRIRSSSQVVILLTASMVVPMAVDHSNKEEHAVHWPTVLCAFSTLLSGLSLYGLVAEFLPARPGPYRYMAIKSLVHVYALFLVSLSFSLSLMVRMVPAATSLTLAVSAVLVTHRLRRCVATALRDDVEGYMGCEEELQQLIELSTYAASMFFGGWFGMAFFYFENYSEVAGHARFLPSEYLTFFVSVGASLLIVKAVPGKPAPDRQQQPVREVMALVCTLVFFVVVTVLVIAESKVGNYVALALVPEAIALIACCAQLLLGLPEWLREYSGAVAGEPAPHNFVGVSLTLLLSVLTYRVKDVRALSSLYDEVFVLLTTADVVAALGWRMLTQPPVPVEAPQVQAAAKILAFFTYCLLVLSVLAFMGVVFGL
ncbi:hypothetical protein PR202_ga27517 [Eleusine coracana subsp. coracana]|uniref:Uncharacterized protein n=1 Tax=Eleusine coracana subsp. coracana TaxID=191504 RepID=A0AAV5DFE6_ELECO|nr:hypothetical protein PR202_ga27517 [Eleusine coracana subsp. coracana]